MNKWKNKNEIEQSLKWLGLLDDDKEFINKISDIENCGTCKYGGSSSPNFTYELHHDNKSFEVVFSKDKKNNYTLKRINNIPFNVLKFTRLLMQWAYLNPNLETITKKCFYDGNHEKRFDNKSKFINYIAEVFYRKLFSKVEGDIAHAIDNVATDNGQRTQTLPNIITHLVNENSRIIDLNKKNNSNTDSEKKDREYFTSIDSYIIMDSLLFHNGKRVFCIFDINHCKNKQPYILSQICTEKEIIYNCTTQNKENILSRISIEFYPKRKIEMNKNGKNITFENASYNIEEPEFWKHISNDDNEHWPRLEPIYQKYCESSSNPDREEFRKYFIQKIEDKIKILKEGENDIGNDNIGQYIENLKAVFFRI